MKKIMNHKQETQFIFEIFSSMGHEISHCIQNIDNLMKNKFIADIKIENIGKNETTIGKMMDYQKQKLYSINEIITPIIERLYHSDRSMYLNEEIRK